MHFNFNIVAERLRPSQLLTPDACCTGQDAEAMAMYEKHVRFMIMGEHELCQSVATAQNPQGHNSHLNIEQMNKVYLFMLLTICFRLEFCPHCTKF